MTTIKLAIVTTTMLLYSISMNAQSKVTPTPLDTKTTEHTEQTKTDHKGSDSSKKEGHSTQKVISYHKKKKQTAYSLPW